MSYWSRVNQIPESISVYENAAEARYLEGWELIRQGYRGGGVYFLGYVAEMLLKAIFFRGSGYDLNYHISSKKRKDTGITRMHDAFEWAQKVIESRTDIDKEISGKLIDCAVIISKNWNEGLRYRDNNPTDEELDEFVDAIAWIEKNQNNLIERGDQIC
jgi:hypothetical protein